MGIPATAKIDRKSYEPAYAQLAKILKRQISDGIYRPGDRLPSEAKLCEAYDVSPMTVRRVVNMLVEQGVAVAEQGRGTFVKPLGLGTAVFHLDALQQFFDDAENTRVKLLETRIVSADERTARKLSISQNQRVVFIRRLISQNGIPSLYHREYLIYDPERPIIEAEMEVTSLRGLFSGASESTLKWGNLLIEATILRDEEARVLNSQSGAAAFRLEHIFYDFDNQPLSLGWFISPGDRLHFKTSVGIQE